MTYNELMVTSFVITYIVIYVIDLCFI